MADPFMAEIRIFTYTFPPRGWADCNGQLMTISQNTAMFSLLGTTYGGDGRSTFALPNLTGSVPIGAGQAPGLSFRELGEKAGTTIVTLRQSDMANHTHAWRPSVESADLKIPNPVRSFAAATGPAYIAPQGQPTAKFAVNAVGNTGGGQPHNNVQPVLSLRLCIALQGIYPPRG